MSIGGPIPREKLSAYERWELTSFDAGSARPARHSAERKPPEPQQPKQQPKPPPDGLRWPTAEEIEKIHQEAHRAGYAAGYEEGTARTRMEAMRLHTMVENLDRALDELDQSVAQALLELAIEISHQVVRQSLELRPEIVIGVVREALAQLAHQHVSIYLHPDDASLVRSYVGDQLTHAGHRILEEPQISRGGCRVEASGSQIDATMETRWRRVLESLGAGESWIAPAQK